MKCCGVLGVMLLILLSSCGGSVVKLTEGPTASSLVARRVTSISCRKTLAMACSTAFSKAIEKTTTTCTGGEAARGELGCKGLQGCTGLQATAEAATPSVVRAAAT